MKTIGFFVGCALAAALVVPALVTSAPEAKDEFSLAGAIPNDILLYVAERHNPEREFLDRYWEEVFDALVQSGIGGDLIDLISSSVGAEHKAEVDRLKERASQLLAGVDWKQLATKEMVFAERLPPPMRIGDDGLVMMPHMVWLLRGSGEGAAHNFEGLAAILDAMAEEVNRAVGLDALAVKRTSRLDGKALVASLEAGGPGAVVVPIIVALHDDLVIIAIGEQILNDVLGLLGGSGTTTALAGDPRFKAAFAKLPKAENSMVFFDVQALLKPIPDAMKTLFGILEAPRDAYRGAGMSAEAGILNARAVAASREGDVKQALALTEQAYNASPESTIVLYNLACFNALLGNKDEALAWLEKAVDGGFYAPGKIAGDPDLQSLRGEPKYKAALAKAAELVAEWRIEDIVINGAKSGEGFRLLLQAHQVYQEKNYEQGLKLSEQAYAVAPKHSRVLYSLACFHALLGHDDKALDFLGQAVNGGFYCPRHMSKDPDWEKLRTHEQFQAALEQARKKAAELATQKAGGELTLVQRLLDRLMEAVGTLDYVATVETTDGYAVWTESITVLVPDAKNRPIYPVFGKRQRLTDFDRYLPQETTSFSVSGGLDLGELYRFLEDSFRGGGPLGEELLAKWGKLQEQFGVNVQKDIVGWIDGDSVSVTLADDDGSVWMIKVTNEQVAHEKVTAAIEFCSTKLTEAVAKNPMLAGLAMLGVRTSPVEHEQLEGFQNLHFAMSPRPAVWGVVDGYLMLGSSADAVALCLATAKGDHPNIRDNARAMSEAVVPAGPFASVSLTDRRGLGEELASGLGIASMVSGMIGTFVPEPKLRPVLAKISGMLGKLTPVVRKIDFYKSEATHTTFDGQMWHSRGVTHYVSPAERAAKGAE